VNPHQRIRKGIKVQKPLQKLRAEVTSSRREFNKALRRYNRALAKYVVAREANGMSALPPKFLRGNFNG
jgi:hypothetical protein